ncbi:hypothetical protein F5I97DRAFT_2032165, partial [Phlebopus sp. FC_14]
SNPLEDTSYLLSAVETITDSVQDRSFASVHDLMDAYSTFSNRIRSQSQVLQSCDKPFPAFDCLVHHKAAFIQALRRDIGLAHSDPLFISSRSRSYGESLPDAAAITHVTSDTRQYARNTSLLCNYALCSLGVIIKFPAFNSLFTVTELTELLGDVLSITLAQNLPILNGAKTFSLSLLILGSHRLPLESVIPLTAKIHSALRRTLEGPDLTTSTAVDGLKAISHTLEYAPCLFLPVSHMVPLILPFLLSKSPDVRLHTSLVLGRLAAFLLRPDTLPQDKTAISKDVLSFLDLHCSSTQASRNNEDLSHVIRTACSVESQARPGEGPTWMFALLASLIILSGPPLFGNPRVLKFILQCLGLALTHQRSVVRALHPHVWKCLAWVLLEIISGTETASPAEIRTAVFVIKQEVGGGVGVTLAAMLLHFAGQRHDRSTEFATHALSVLQAMVHSDDKHTFQDGVSLLRVMTAGTGRVESDQRSLRAFDDILSPALFDGSLVCADWPCLPSVIRSMPRFSSLSVRPLTSAEIVAHYEPLLDTWKHCARKQAKEMLSVDLLDAWRSIVSVQSQLTADVRPTTDRSQPLEPLAMVIIEFLPSLPCPDTEPQWGSWDVRDQQRRLATMYQLWLTMQDVFVSTRLAGPAETILVSILKFAFHILDPDVKVLWSHLCATLMVAVSPSFLSDMCNLSECQMAVQTQRSLWGVVVKSLTSSKIDLYWEDVVRLLAIPVCKWTLSESELEAWGLILRNASSSGVSSTPFVLVVETFMTCIEGRGANDWCGMSAILLGAVSNVFRRLSMPALLGVITACFQAERVLPSDVVLRSVDNALISSYDRALDSADSNSPSLDLLAALRDYVRGSTPAQVLHLLVTLRHGLQIWIEDKSEVVSIDDFNTMVISLYRDSLDILAGCPLGVGTLQELETFLASGFSRIPAPAIAPFAFEKFWRTTYHGKTQFYDFIPPRIKSCLLCFVAAYGGDLADGLSFPVGSQSQGAIDVHESQLPPSFSDIPWGLVKRDQPDEVLDDHTTGATGRRSLAPEDTAFLVASSNDEESCQPKVLQPLGDCSWGIHSSPPDALGQTPGFPRRRVQEQNRKRKQPVGVKHMPKKRNKTLHIQRKAKSEPVRGGTIRISAPRINSVPVTCGKLIFDGVELPTLRDILRLEQGPSSKQPTRSGVHSEHEEGRASSDLFDGTSSETEKSLAAVYPSSPRGQNPLASESRIDPGETQRQKFQAQGSPSVPGRAPLRRSNTTLARLDALRDVYASVASGASQRPPSELVQATNLVHQIGVVLTEQMGKKFGTSG